MSNSSTAMQAFAFDSHAVRVVTINNEPWFVAKDVCACIEHTNPAMAIKPLDDDEKGISSVYTLGGSQDMAVLSESGLYTLILRSRNATTPGTPAHTFRKWVTAEVLPSIRKTGSYAAPVTGQSDWVQVSQADISSLIASQARLMEMLVPVMEHLTQAATTPAREKRPAPSPWTDEEKDQLIGLMAKGLSQNAIAKELGRSPASISKYAAIVRVK